MVAIVFITTFVILICSNAAISGDNPDKSLFVCTGSELDQLFVGPRPSIGESTPVSNKEDQNVLRLPIILEQQQDMTDELYDQVLASHCKPKEQQCEVDILPITEIRVNYSPKAIKNENEYHLDTQWQTIEDQSASIIIQCINANTCSKLRQNATSLIDSIQLEFLASSCDKKEPEHVNIKISGRDAKNAMIDSQLTSISETELNKWLSKILDHIETKQLKHKQVTFSSAVEQTRIKDLLKEALTIYTDQTENYSVNKQAIQRPQKFILRENVSVVRLGDIRSVQFRRLWSDSGADSVVNKNVTANQTNKRETSTNEDGQGSEEDCEEVEGDEENPVEDQTDKPKKDEGEFQPEEDDDEDFQPEKDSEEDFQPEDDDEGEFQPEDDDEVEDPEPNASSNSTNSEVTTIKTTVSTNADGKATTNLARESTTQQSSTTKDRKQEITTTPKTEVSDESDGSGLAMYEQCGGILYKGSKQCGSNLKCYARNQHYSSCRQENDCPIDWACSVMSSEDEPVPPPTIILAYHQCDPNTYSKCVTGAYCYKNTDVYSECRPSCPHTWVCETERVEEWEQCGGTGYKGPKKCVDGLACFQQSQWYSQCLTKCPDNDTWDCAKKKKNSKPSSSGKTTSNQ